MGKHTAGPWEAEGSEILLHGTPYRVAEVSDHNGYRDLEISEVLANARLIAAAPELLELVQDLKASLPEDPEIDQRIDAVLAKATGQDND